MTTAASTRRSLRVRWNRAIAGVAAALVVGGAASVGGSMYLISSFGRTAEAIEADASLLAHLRTDVVAETIALSATTGDRLSFLAATALGPQVDASFARAITSASPQGRAALMEASTTWAGVVRAIGGLSVSTSAEERGAVLGSALAVDAPKVLVLLDEAGERNRAAARAALDAHRSVAWPVVIGLLLVNLLGLGMLLRLGRRLTHQVLAPVEQLRSSANLLAAGDLSHRVPVPGDDELGALATSFNAMADAVAGSQRVLTVQANEDSLTGLANRAAFRRRVVDALAQSERRGGTQAVLFLDLDDFKDVNDQLGHAAGDELLRVVANRLVDIVRTGDLVARLGGDEFALLLDGIPDLDGALALAERAVSVISAPVPIGSQTVHVGASVGVAMRAEDSDVEVLLQQADVAMYAAKAHGKNRVERYDASLQHAEAAHRALKAELAVATARGELTLDYQPVIDLNSGSVAGVEALVRWQHPTRGLLPPSAFIEFAEQTGVIGDIGSWVLGRAAAQMHSWQRRYNRPELSVAVNVSARQLASVSFTEVVQNVLDSTGLDPASLVLEVTESVLVDDTGLAAQSLGALREMGVRISIDDFGTGFASIGYLRTLPVDILKIDRSFVSGATAEPSQRLLEAVVRMGQQLGLEVIPEGIERAEELSRLRVLGCTVGQGFLLSQPISPEAIDAWLADADRPLGIEFLTGGVEAIPVPRPTEEGLRRVPEV